MRSVFHFVQSEILCRRRGVNFDRVMRALPTRMRQSTGRSDAAGPTINRHYTNRFAAAVGSLNAGCWMLDAGCWMLDAGAHPANPTFQFHFYVDFYRRFMPLLDGPSSPDFHLQQNDFYLV